MHPFVANGAFSTFYRLDNATGLPAVRLSARFIHAAATGTFSHSRRPVSENPPSDHRWGTMLLPSAIPAWHPAGHPAGFASPRPLLTLPQTSIFAPESNHQRSSNFVIAALWKWDMYTVVNAQRRSLFPSNGYRLHRRLVGRPIRLVDAGLVNVRVGISRG
jgi:hypothetical protein